MIIKYVATPQTQLTFKDVQFGQMFRYKVLPHQNFSFTQPEVYMKSYIDDKRNIILTNLVTGNSTFAKGINPDAVVQLLAFKCNEVVDSDE